MNFTIAHAGYRVKVRDGLLTDEKGEEAAGIYDWRKHVVLLAGSEQMPVQRRAETLAHELWHLWKLKFGTTADEESEANQIASFAIWFLHELERNGGEGALMRLTPEGVCDRTSAIGIAADDRHAQCRVCHGLLDLPLRMSAPRFDPASPRLLVDVEGDCEFCGHTVTWKETCNSRGIRTGTVIGEQVVKTAAAAVS